MLRIALTIFLCLTCSAAFAAQSTNAIGLLFITVVAICIILLLITTLLYFVAKTSESLWVTILLALAGIATFVTSAMMLRQCVIENGSANDSGFAICYIATGATILGGLWAVGAARRRQKEIFTIRGRHA